MTKKLANSDGKKYSYDWIYAKTLKNYLPRRNSWFRNYGIVAVSFFLILILLNYLFNREMPLGFHILSLLAGLLMVPYGFVLFLFLYATYIETSPEDRDRKTSDCIKILEEADLELSAIRKFERRAAADAGTAQTFSLLPILILTLTFPIALSELANLLRALSKIANQTFLSKILASAQEKFTTSASSTETFEFLVATVILVATSAIFLYTQLGRANISVVIQHACIERGAELESQQSKNDEEANVNLKGGETSPRETSLVSTAVAIIAISASFLYEFRRRKT